MAEAIIPAHDAISSVNPTHDHEHERRTLAALEHAYELTLLREMEREVFGEVCE